VITVTVCVGSSCHVKGARNLIDNFQRLLKEYRMEGLVELKGSFCMERCGEGVNWRINDELLTSLNVKDAVSLFKEKVLKPMAAGKG
jgi:NADH:ubiquinone oxidoreductase subunit E